MALLLFLAGCDQDNGEVRGSGNSQTEIPEYDPNNPEPWCDFAGSFLGNQWATDAQHDAVLILMNNRGCLN